jgi:hypothetical protein
MSNYDEKNQDGEGKDGGESKMASFDWMPAGCQPLADGEYDAIILGTGLTDCIISGECRSIDTSHISTRQRRAAPASILFRDQGTAVISFVMLG